jgi:hypothetical protein
VGLPPADRFHLGVVQSAQSLFVEYLIRLAEVPAPVTVEQETPIRVAHGKIDVMQAGNNRCALIGFFPEQTQRIELVLRIEMICRFIEQVDIRLLR